MANPIGPMDGGTSSATGMGAPAAPGTMKGGRSVQAIGEGTAAPAGTSRTRGFGSLLRGAFWSAKETILGRASPTPPPTDEAELAGSVSGEIFASISDSGDFDTDTEYDSSGSGSGSGTNEIKARRSKLAGSRRRLVMTNKKKIDRRTLVDKHEARVEVARLFGELKEAPQAFSKEIVRTFHEKHTVKDPDAQRTLLEATLDFVYEQPNSKDLLESLVIEMNGLENKSMLRSPQSMLSVLREVAEDYDGPLEIIDEAIAALPVSTIGPLIQPHSSALSGREEELANEAEARFDQEVQDRTTQWSAIATEADGYQLLSSWAEELDNSPDGGVILDRVLADIQAEGRAELLGPALGMFLAEAASPREATPASNALARAAREAEVDSRMAELDSASPEEQVDLMRGWAEAADMGTPLGQALLSATIDRSMHTLGEGFVGVAREVASQSGTEAGQVLGRAAETMQSLADLVTRARGRFDAVAKSDRDGRAEALSRFGEELAEMRNSLGGEDAKTLFDSALNYAVDNQFKDKADRGPIAGAMIASIPENQRQEFVDRMVSLGIRQNEKTEKDLFRTDYFAVKIYSEHMSLAAADWLNTIAGEGELRELFSQFGEDQDTTKLASALMDKTWNRFYQSMRDGSIPPAVLRSTQHVRSELRHRFPRSTAVPSFVGTTFLRLVTPPMVPLSMNSGVPPADQRTLRQASSVFVQAFANGQLMGLKSEAGDIPYGFASRDKPNPEGFPTDEVNALMRAVAYQRAEVERLASRP